MISHYEYNTLIPQHYSLTFFISTWATKSCPGFCHVRNFTYLSDVLEMPYRPNVINSGKPNEKAYTYRFGGPTCLAGDIIGEYSFDKPLKVGDKIIFCDMAIYSMVKNNTFNGMPLPDIAVLHEDDTIEVVKSFGYEDFKMRLS